MAPVRAVLSLLAALALILGAAPAQAAPAAVTIDPIPNQTTGAGVAVSLQVQLHGAVAPITASAAGLPPGIAINPTTGLISGTPNVPGTYQVTITVHDASGASASVTFTWVVLAVDCGTSQLIVNPGFEQGQTGWTSSPGVIGQWGPGNVHGGTWSAQLDGYGTTHTDTLAQTVAIPAGCGSYTLAFSLRITSQETSTTTAYDRMTVKLGQTTLATYSNLNRSAGFVVKAFDARAFAGRTVTLQFTGTEDASRATSFFLDDVTLTVT